jgi:hypothetical protein
MKGDANMEGLDGPEPEPLSDPRVELLKLFMGDVDLPDDRQTADGDTGTGN